MQEAEELGYDNKNVAEYVKQQQALDRKGKKDMELKAQDQAGTRAADDLPPRNRDAKSPKLPAFTDERDE